MLSGPRLAAAWCSLRRDLALKEAWLERLWPALAGSGRPNRACVSTWRRALSGHPHSRKVGAPHHALAPALSFLQPLLRRRRGVDQGFPQGIEEGRLGRRLRAFRRIRSFLLRAFRRLRAFHASVKAPLHVFEEAQGWARRAVTSGNGKGAMRQLVRGAGEGERRCREHS